MLKVKIENLTSPRTGRAVPNQYIIDTPEGRYFQSYKSVIAVVKPDGRVFLDPEYWDYSVTTNRYRNQFLGESIKETRQKIESGEYAFMDLN